MGHDSKGRWTWGSPWERFLANIDPHDDLECWRWKASVDKDGYAKFYANGKHIRGHNYAYIEIYGPIPEGLQLDHLCRVRSCVNPCHLQPVTVQENIKRGNSGELERSKQTCPQGHPYDIIQYVSRKRSIGIVRQARRRCSICCKEQAQRWIAKVKGGEIAHG